MAETDNTEFPLISIIIPCYNHGHFLSVAIESVLEQSYKSFEIIVVDDGSADDTRTVATSYPEVRYIFQENSGLSASRNKGIANCKGDYVICLDADDWLYKDGIKINLQYLLQKPEAAFVSGGYEKIFTDADLVVEEKREVADKHYIKLMQHGNFITVPGAVMYRRWVFNEFQFDTTLRACEDYDLYLKISKKYPVIHHTEKVAAYRRHSANMSSADEMMMKTALSVLERQRSFLDSIEEQKAFKKGMDRWKSYYCNEIYKKLKAGHIQPTLNILSTVLHFKPKYLLKYLLLKLHFIK